MVRTSGKLKKNIRLGEMAAAVAQLGYVPPCVADAFSWLPHPFTQVGRGRKKKVLWFWEVYGDPPPAQSEWNGQRCGECIFQEPKWSQKYPRCAHSWCHDDDGDCQAFYSVDEFLEVNPSYADFCRVPTLDGSEHLLDTPYLPDGTTYREFKPCCRFPSHHHARIDMTWWYQNEAVRNTYAAVEYERLRRFQQHVAEETAREEGGYQMDMFLDLARSGEA